MDMAHNLSLILCGRGIKKGDGGGLFYKPKKYMNRLFLNNKDTAI